MNVIVSRICFGRLTCRLGVLFAAMILAPASAYAQFDPPAEFRLGVGTGVFPNAVVIADFNRDGHEDIAAQGGGTGVQVSFGRGDATFLPQPVIRIPGGDVAGISKGDLNGDGRVDLIIGGVGRVHTLLGNGDGTFRAARAWPTGAPGDVNGVAVADVNDDRLLDVVTVSLKFYPYTTELPYVTVSVMFGNGDGTLRPPTVYPLGRATFYQFHGSVIIADLNRDGWPDLSVLRDGSLPLDVLFGTRAGAFAAPIPIDMGSAHSSQAYAQAIADLNGDGALDLVGVQPAGVSVRLGNGDGTFSPVTVSPVTGPFQPGTALIRDLDGDDVPDLVVTGNFTLYTMGTQLFYGNGDGTFRASTYYDSLAFSAATGDFNEDGRPDIVTRASEIVGVLLNRTPFAVDHFTITLPPVAFVAQRVNATVTAYNQFGGVFHDYRGQARFDTSDTHTCRMLPAVYAFTARDNGTHVFEAEVALRTVGPQTVTVADFDLRSANGTTTMRITDVGSTVVTTVDDTVAADGETSLREAIINANAHRNVGGPDRVEFNICGGGAHVIRPTSALPVLSEAVIVDGFTQPWTSENTAVVGYDAVFSIVLNGQLAGEDVDGLTVEAPCVVRGLIVQEFRGSGIRIQKSSGSEIKGNFIGTRFDGLEAAGNLKNGITVLSSDNVIGGRALGDRNVISGNGGDGIDLDFFIGGNVRNRIIQNYIGVSATGTAPLGNGGAGVRIDSGSENEIGAATAAARNVIAGNAGAGVIIKSGLSAASANKVAGNYIGLNVNGSAALPNGGAGLFIDNSTLNIIGGNKAAEGNAISGNTGPGVLLVAATGNRIYGNQIGTDPGGTFAIGNGSDGVLLKAGSHRNLVGAAGKDFRNIISGNRGAGLSIAGGNANVVSGNSIGVNADGSRPLPNGGDGIAIMAPDGLSASDNRIGGSTVGEGNIIANNGGAGVFVSGGSGNSITVNRIFTNTGLGIDLGASGVTPNDADDSDAGPNGLQNFPQVSAVLLVLGGTEVRGTLHTAPGVTARLEFYSNVEPDPSEHGEGQTYLGNVTVTADASGNAPFTATVTGMSPYEYLTATATSAANDTSEFSLAVRPDSDLDGIIDAFELDHSLDPFNPKDAGEDADADRHTNLEEYTAGTDPRDAASAPGLKPGGFRGDDFVIRFSSLDGRFYNVQYTEDLSSGSWSLLVGDVPGTGDIVEVIDRGVAGLPPRYYRVRVRPLPGP